MSNASQPDFSHEAFHAKRLNIPQTSICGVDEAGRGPWAGPVVAAAVILDPKRIPKGIGDSKQLSTLKREALYQPILDQAIDFRIGIVEADEIDAINILAATHKAMAQAVVALHSSPNLALIDGNRAPNLPCPTQCIIGGDGLSLSIAAASILAKVTRDRIMAKADSIYPGYGFGDHKGYGTKAHRTALDRLGPCKLHRLSIKPLKGFNETY
ncbi:ribonuclease HII [Candidatus Phycosocius spiralis]|uniref:Ribonuclease HII n=1 Tax=Candidatus Phycosocius spiralis TaxID=2815099 RepID=A0ABQ4PW97_9PROT|nr:ribonuclease HII [Candidatus Phycosocius spiralis]GIU67335.1 ribonuclease HII [Candidatus Phycosocius spiralis]